MINVVWGEMILEESNDWGRRKVAWGVGRFPPQWLLAAFNSPFSLLPPSLSFYFLR